MSTRETVDSILNMPCSWREYVANVFLESGHVNRAAIVGQDGRRWAASPAFDVTASEVQAILDGFVDSSAIRALGISLSNKRYTCTRQDSTVMVGRDSATGFGCVIYRCKLCLIIGVYEESGHPGGCYSMLVKVGDYLKDQGY
ncbi:profilin-2-like isoform X1 [Pecten maximus]|uniref:profilin-2-like isoform X1 n=1 Tax=Pecten maximus TaxID=6579 RepID=UPI0014590840|nr:profilin-2-like isoform X1 [Pecten maximus]